jgi:hypothetical protein
MNKKVERRKIVLPRDLRKNLRLINAFVTSSLNLGKQRSGKPNSILLLNFKFNFETLFLINHTSFKEPLALICYLV